MELLPINHRFPKKPEISNKDWKIFRRTILDKYNYQCHFCDSKSKKFLQCLKINKKEFVPVCFLCKTIITAKPKYALIVVHSKLTQRDIVRITNRYIKSHKCIPNFKFIDKTVKKAPLTVSQFVTILKSKKKLPDEFNNLKVFFNNRLKLNTIGITNQDVEEMDELDEHVFNDDTKEFIDDIFNDTTEHVKDVKVIKEDPYYTNILNIQYELKYHREIIKKINKEFYRIQALNHK